MPVDEALYEVSDELVRMARYLRGQARTFDDAYLTAIHVADEMEALSRLIVDRRADAEFDASRLVRRGPRS